MTELYKALKIKKKLADEIDEYVHNYNDTSLVALLDYLLTKYKGDALIYDKTIVYALFVAGVEQGIRYMLNLPKEM
jgi:hypothetical protein